MAVPEVRRRMVGERLAELREQKALTLHELEELSGVGADSISKIENGHRKPRPSTLRKLARALGVEVADFFPKGQAPLPDFEDKRRLSPSGPRPAELPFDVTELAREALAESGADTEEDVSRVLDRAFAEALAGHSRTDLSARYEWADHDVLHALANMPASRAELVRAQLERYAADAALRALDPPELPPREALEAVA